MYRVYDHYQHVKDLTNSVIYYKYDFKLFFCYPRNIKLGNYEINLDEIQKTDFEVRPMEAAENALDKILFLKKYANLLDPRYNFYLNDENELVSYLRDESWSFNENQRLKDQLLLSLNKMEENTRSFIKKYIENENRKKLKKEKDEKLKIYRKNKPIIQKLFNEGMDYITNNEYPNAVVIFSKAIKIDIEDSITNELYLRRSFAKFELHDFLGCIEDLTKSLSYYPKITEVYYKRAHAYLQIKKLNEAISDFDETIALEPYNELAFFYRGLCKIKSGDKENGCRDLSIAGELGYFEAYEEIKKNCN
ncbi:MAG: hypothetical protein RQ864_07120 [Lutibacter sp.]|nr:hypothetical protein [Lutibacter sp.]